MAVEDSKHQELVEEFMLSVGKMVRGMRAIFRREMERYDVTWPQFHLLKFVRDSDGITVMELSHMLMISAPTTSRMIDGLCSKGLLEKEKDEHDHRVTRLQLSVESESLLKALTDLQDKIWLEVFAEEDTAELQRTVSHIGSITDKWLEIAGNREKER
jgi:MarR family transcriptional regulator, 2-MHQ and catechol-resistance regulon repressor